MFLQRESGKILFRVNKLKILKKVYYTMKEMLKISVTYIKLSEGVLLTHLRRSWLQSTSASVLEESIDKTKVLKTLLFKYC